MKPLQTKGGSHLCLQAKARKHNMLGTNSTSTLEHICLSAFLTCRNLENWEQE